MPTTAGICSSRNAPLAEVIKSHATTFYLPTLTNTVLPTRTDASQSPLPTSSITHKCVAYDWILVYPPGCITSHSSRSPWKLIHERRTGESPTFPTWIFATCVELKDDPWTTHPSALSSAGVNAANKHKPDRAPMDVIKPLKLLCIGWGADFQVFIATFQQSGFFWLPDMPTKLKLPTAAGITVRSQSTWGSVQVLRHAPSSLPGAIGFCHFYSFPACHCAREQWCWWPSGDEHRRLLKRLNRCISKLVHNKTHRIKEFDSGWIWKR